MKPALLLAGAATFVFATPAAAQSGCTPEHAAMGHCTLEPAQVETADPHAGHHVPVEPATKTDPHAGHAMPVQPVAPVTTGHGTGGTALSAGDGPAPAASEANYADRVWGDAAMAPSRAQLRREHGGGTFSQLMIDTAEYRLRDGRDGYEWDAEAWFGGDINRLVIKTEGEGAFGESIEQAEIQALYSRAIDPYFNLQAGFRHDITPNPSRTYATVGFEGLAPYWFEVEGALFLSDKGDVLARLEGSYDQRLTQRTFLQPAAEFNFAMQDVPENGIGSGLSTVELALRLRYEITREFAPYVGVVWERSVGDTARFARAAGEDAESTSFVIGARMWF